MTPLAPGRLSTTTGRSSRAERRPAPPASGPAGATAPGAAPTRSGTTSAAPRQAWPGYGPGPVPGCGRRERDMRRARREILRAAAVAPVAGLLPGAPAAAAWPERPVRLIVTFPAGSLTDVLTCQLAEGLSRVLGQPVVVDNRAGAQGIVGIRALLGAPADGHTLVIVGVTTGATNVHLVKDLPYHPLKDLTPVGYIGESPYMLVAAPDLPAADTNELLDLARRRPGSVSFSYGSGSAQVAGALLAKLAGVEVLPVPYRGGPEALNDVMAGRGGYTFT